MTPSLPAHGPGSRGGNVRSVEEAQALQETFKAELSARIDAAIREVLVRTGEFHSDDLVELEVPAEHANLIGVRVARMVSKKWMTEVGRRKVRNPAGNGRRSGVYALTEAGRAAFGDPKAVPEDPEYRIDDETGCWMWQRSLNHSGYGLVRDDGPMRSAHRVYYERSKGTIPAGHHLDHLCGRPGCVNPDHLEAVTPMEHARRHRRLSDDQVREIRFSDGTCRSVGAAFGVSAMIVSKIRRRLLYADVVDTAIAGVGARGGDPVSPMEGPRGADPGERRADVADLRPSLPPDPAPPNVSAAPPTLPLFGGEQPARAGSAFTDPEAA